MDRNPREHFETVIELAHAKLTDVRVLQNDVSSNRAILQIRGKYRSFDVWLKEILLRSGNIYSYYVVKEDTVIVGFDNYPDARILQAKFGKRFRSHLEDLVPHRHGRDKQSITLTNPLNAKEFLNLLEELVLD